MPIIPNDASPTNYTPQEHADFHNILADLNNGIVSPVTLGYAENTSLSQVITSEADVAGLSVTVTVPAGRRLRISGFVLAQSATLDAQVSMVVKEGATQLLFTRKSLRPASVNLGIPIEGVITPTAGSHTYVIRAAATASSTLAGAVGAPAYILVEDITGSYIPVDNTAVPVGVLGYAEKLSAQTGITSSVQITGLSVNVAVPAGRTLRVKLHTGLQRTVADGLTRFFINKDGVTIQFKDMFVRGAAEGHINVDFDVIDSPSAGAHVYTAHVQQVTGSGTSTIGANAGEPTFLLVEDITPTPAPSSGAPGSTLGYAEVTANQGPFTAATDIIGLSSTVTVPAGRRLRISCEGLLQSTVADDTMQLAIQEGATVLQTIRILARPGVSNLATAGSVVITPSSGSHTYKIVGARSGGTGNITLVAAATAPAFILVEDITGSVWPEGSEVTAGMIASEPWTDFVPVVTQGVALTESVAYARYFKLGRLVHLQINTGFISSGTAGQTVSFTLPIQAAAGGFRLIGNADFYDASTMAKYQLGARLNNSTTVVTFQYASSNSDHLLGSSGVFTAAVTNGDALTLNLMYEAAS